MAGILTSKIPNTRYQTSSATVVFLCAWPILPLLNIQLFSLHKVTQNSILLPVIVAIVVLRDGPDCNSTPTLLLPTRLYDE
ncbi:hypothetical protein M433DRAFT_331475 [Acidomyces richmondensis BFW]|nr:MAG: hypothetical protein FE78DRAFT_512534 [Acidomyces sp. 'richmondensis']KYG49231.1 hypothetical protein M433DRAFT_331475 [Acidomyces richmondensis BFW]